MSQAKNRDESGFTLIEIAIVLMISGVFLLAVAEFIKTYTINAKYERTVEHAELTQDVLFEYYAREGGYPCPADPDLGPNDINYGIAQCRSDTDYLANTNDCTGMPAGITCLDPATSQARDFDQDGASDIVLVGAFPFRTIADYLNDLDGEIANTPYTERAKKDGYGSLFTYAVTESMTTVNPDNRTFTPANPYSGAIVVEDENGTDLTVPRGSAHYILLSHGENMRGGYSQEGEQAEDCNVATVPIGGGGTPPPTTPPVGGVLDIELENCNFDNAVFIKGARSTANGSGYYDDLLFYKAVQSSAIWRKNPITEYIYNANEGDAGVGTDDPNDGLPAKLHVVGNVLTEGLATATEYCDGQTDVCLDPQDLAGAGSNCENPNEVAYAISEGQVVCTPVDWQIPSVSCPVVTGQQTYLHAISNRGRITCCFEDGTGCNTYGG